MNSYLRTFLITACVLAATFFGIMLVLGQSASVFRNPGALASFVKPTSTVPTPTNATAPTFTPNGGATATGTNVLISNTWPAGTMVFWTTNGVNPSTNTVPPNGTDNTYGGVGPQVITSIPVCTLKALAWTNDGYTLPSTVSSAVFTQWVAECVVGIATPGTDTGTIAAQDLDAYRGFWFSNSQDRVLCGVSFSMKTSAGNISTKGYQAFLYSLSGQNLNTKLAESQIILGSTLTGTKSTNLFTFSTPYALSSNVNIAVCLTSTNGWDGTNYAAFYYTSTPTNWYMDKWKTDKTIDTHWSASYSAQAIIHWQQ